MRKIIFCILYLFTLSLFANQNSSDEELQKVVSAYKEKYIKLLEEAKAYENGIGVQKDEGKAFLYYEKAATNWNYTRPEPLEYLEKKAEEGNVYAQYYFGIFYNDTEWRSYDFEKAFYWFNKAAEQNYAPAIYSTGILYIRGIGVQKDEKKGYESIFKSAEMGYEFAQLFLGENFIQGNAGKYLEYEKSNKYVQAVKWYSKAASQGNWRAQYDLGVCYFYGWGINEDKKKAFELWKKSLDINFSMLTAFAIARCYYEGWGTEKDHKKAYEFIENFIKLRNINATPEGILKRISEGSLKYSPIRFYFGLKNL